MTAERSNERNGYMSCPRNCGVDVRNHNSSGLINGRCDTDINDVPLLDTGGYLVCGCHGTQRDHTCMSLD